VKRVLNAAGIAGKRSVGNVMLGYWQDGQASAQALRDGWLYTGDLGHRDAEGFL
jgi:long-subunit acyl-CoA synthetase (AMP-forming)